jgi:DNA repair photolyase
MILNISGRTDIVAFYSKWFMNRYKEGFVDVKNPFYPTNISRIYFKDVDAILFCTKNPIPIIKHLKEIDKPILFHITLTPYKQDIEPNVPNKKEIIEAIKKISSIIGIDRISVRYDPVFLNNKYNIDYHIKVFNRMCTLLDGYVKTIIISFIDDYKNVRNNINILKIKEFTENDYQQIGINFSKIAASHGMTVQTCYEEKNLVEYGFKKGECLSHQLAYQLTGKANFKSWSARKGKKCN